MKNLMCIVAMIFTLPMAARAESEIMVCASKNASTIILVEEMREVSPPEDSINYQATMILVRVKGKYLGERIPLAGQRVESASGFYYEFSAPFGYGLFLAAPASQSDSEFTDDGKITNLSCD